MGEAALARSRRSRLGFIYQFFQLLNHMTVLDNVMLPAQLAGRRAAAARTQAEQLLADLGVADDAHRYPGQLSGGQQQAVAVARALGKVGGHPGVAVDRVEVALAPVGQDRHARGAARTRSVIRWTAITTAPEDAPARIASRRTRRRQPTTHSRSVTWTTQWASDSW